jgi:hypothetical protein
VVTLTSIALSHEYGLNAGPDLGPAALRRPPTCPGIGRAAHHSTFRAVATCQRPRPDVWDTPRRHHGLLRIRPCSPRNSALSRAATGKGAHVQSGRQSSPAGLSAIRTSVGLSADCSGSSAGLWIPTRRMHPCPRDKHSGGHHCRAAYAPALTADQPVGRPSCRWERCTVVHFGSLTHRAPPHDGLPARRVLIDGDQGVLGADVADLDVLGGDLIGDGTQWQARVTQDAHLCQRRLLLGDRHHPPAERRLAAEVLVAGLLRPLRCPKEPGIPLPDTSSAPPLRSAGTGRPLTPSTSRSRSGFDSVRHFQQPFGCSGGDDGSRRNPVRAIQTSGCGSDARCRPVSPPP